MGQEFQKTLEKFEAIQASIPENMRWKLAYMAAHLQGTAKPFEQLSESQQEAVTDIYELNKQTLKLVFVSIVKSIVSPKLHCSFEKQCRLKIHGYMSKWVKAYIDFGNDHIYFNKVKGTTKFRLRGLQCLLVQGKPKLQFLYKGTLRATIKFEKQESADSILEQIKQLQKSINQSSDQLRMRKNQVIRIDAMTSEGEKLKLFWANQSKIVRLHEKQPKIYAEIFIKTENQCGVSELLYFLISHRIWNSKIKSEQINLNQLMEECDFIVERVYKSPTLLMSERKTITKLSIKHAQAGSGSLKNSKKSFVNGEKYSLRNHNPKFIITEEDISGQYVTGSKKSKWVLAEMNLMMVVEVMSQKLFKIVLEADFDGKGHSRKQNNRHMLKIIFSDIVFWDNKLKSRIKRSSKQKKEKNQAQLVIRNQIDKILERLKSDCTGQEANKQMEKSEEQPEGLPNHLESNESFMTIDGQLNSQEDVMLYDLDSSKNETESDKEEIKTKDEVTTELKSQALEAEKKQPTRRQSFATHNQPEEAFHILAEKSPKKLSDRISFDYLRLLKQKIYEIAYLKQHFSQEGRDSFDEETPFYCPSLLTNNGRDYLVNENKELIFINEDLIRGQKDSLKSIIKQVGANIISGKSVMDVSLPVDIFESRSLLEREAATFSCAPRYLRSVADTDILTQMNHVVGFLMSVPPLELVMQKPFNPILGETFHGYIGGVSIYFEQISHHPPVNSYFLKCEEFTMAGNLIATANVGLNSGYGKNVGILNIAMKNGSEFQLHFPPAQISGLIYGSRKYGVYDRCYALCKSHRLMCEVSFSKESKGLYEKDGKEKLKAGDVLGGIFRIKSEVIKAFTDTLSSGKDFPGLKKNNVDEKIASVTGTWFEDIFINGKNMTKGVTAYPVEYADVRLPSDSNYRLDVMLHRFGDLARSQIEKQLLENLQRSDRKLREKHWKQNQK